MAKNPYFDEEDEDIAEPGDDWTTSPFANITKPPEGKKRIVKKPVVEVETVEYFEDDDLEDGENTVFPESEVSISDDDAEFFYSATAAPVEVTPQPVRRQPVRKRSETVPVEPIEEDTLEEDIPETVDEADEAAAAEEFLRQKALERRLERERASVPPAKPAGTEASDRYKWAQEKPVVDEYNDRESFDSRIREEDSSHSGSVDSNPYDEDEETSEEKNKKRGFFGKKKGKNDRKNKKKVEPNNNGRKSRRDKNSAKDKSGGRKTETDDEVLSGKPVSGGRWKLLALRTVIWLFLGLFLALGIKQAFFPSKITAASVTEEVGLSLGINGFPKVEGENIGKRFVSTYLTVTPDNSSQRREQLSAYIVGNEDPTWANVSSATGRATQIVTAGPYLVNQPILVDNEGNPTTVRCDLMVAPCRAVYIFAVQLTDPKAVTSTGEKAEPTWIYLSVPIIASETKETGVGVAVADAPAFVAAPAGVNEATPIEMAADDVAAASLEKDLPNFFTGWAASNVDSIKRYTPDGTIPPPIITAGLQKTVKFVNVNKVFVQKAEGSNVTASTPKFAQAEVTWTNLSGFTFQQVYRMKVQQTGDKWYILDLQGGGFPVSDS